MKVIYLNWYAHLKLFFLIYTFRPNLCEVYNNGGKTAANVQSYNTENATFSVNGICFSNKCICHFYRKIYFCVLDK